MMTREIMIRCLNADIDTLKGLLNRGIPTEDKIKKEIEIKTAIIAVLKADLGDKEYIANIDRETDAKYAIYWIGYNKGYEDGRDGKERRECANSNFSKVESCEMRNPTEQEQKSIDDYVKSISRPTGFNAFGEPCGDCVSREAVLNILPKYRLEESKIAEETKALPSVTPEIPKGEWKVNDKNVLICNNCNTWFERDREEFMNFCPYCGADMRGEQK